MLRNNRPFIPKVSALYPTATSSNDLALAAIAGQDPPANGAVFQALSQSAGRGQGQNSWHASPYANLSLSIVAYPGHLSPSRLFALNQVCALSVAATVRDFLGPSHRTCVRVKWPNDVLAGQQKIAGILIQNSLQGQSIAWSVMGIGLNVNESKFPPELRPHATSLQLLTGEEHDLEIVRTTLFQHLSTNYALTDHRLLPTLDRNYHRQLHLLDHPATFRHEATGRQFAGSIRGVNPAGQLRISMLGERESAFNLREIKLVGPR